MKRYDHVYFAMSMYGGKWLLNANSILAAKYGDIEHGSPPNSRDKILKRFNGNMTAPSFVRRGLRPMEENMLHLFTKLAQLYEQ